MLTIKQNRDYNHRMIRACKICAEPLLRCESGDFCAWHAPQINIKKCAICHAGMDKLNGIGSCKTCFKAMQLLSDKGKVLFAQQIAIGDKTHNEVLVGLRKHQLAWQDTRTGEKSLPVYDRMLQCVSRELRVPLSELVSAKKKSRAVRARAVIAKGLLSKGHKLSAVGRLMGGMHHGTILAMRNNFPMYCEQDPRLLSALEMVKEI
jgi:hypothetical protein